MSLLSYNGVTLPYSFTTSFSQEAVQDESNTDWYLTKFDITVQCIINGDYISWLAPDIQNVGTGNAAGIMNVIRTRLLQKRRALSFIFNGTNLIPQPTAGRGTVDSKNGPEPMFCSVTSLYDETFLLTYRIVAHYWESNTVDTDLPNFVENNAGNSVLNNRWTETVDMDNCMYSTRTREGKYIIRSDNAAGETADFFRNQMAVLSVPKGFTRDSSSYTVTADGLAIQYRIVDKEYFIAPPNGAFEADGEYYESTTKKGNVRWGECRIRLRSSKTYSRAALLGRALLVSASKIGISGAKVNKKGFAILEIGSCKINMYQNECEVVLKAQLEAVTKDNPDARAYGVPFAVVARMNQNPIDNIRNEDIPYEARGTASILLQAASYYDPSLRNIRLGPGINAAQNSNTLTGTQKVQLMNTPGQVGQLGVLGEP